MSSRKLKQNGGARNFGRVAQFGCQNGIEFFPTPDLNPCKFECRETLHMIGDILLNSD